MRYLMALVCLVAVTSPADAKIWGDFIAGGTSCNSSNVSVIDSGDNLSVLFDDFGVNMPQSDMGDGMSARKTCNFRIQLTPPKGYYLAGFKQLYSGGIIKSAGSSAQLSIRYNIGTVTGMPKAIAWPRGYAIDPNDSSAQFSRTFDNNLLVASCGGSTNYGINMSFTAVRDSVDPDFVVGGLDSVDASFVQKITLIPAWALCH